MEAKYLGKHLIVEFYGCSSKIIDDMKFLEKTLEESVAKAGGNILGKLFHKFKPQGVTGIIAVSESHVSIHTWPENGYVAIDAFTCGREMDPWTVYRKLRAKIKPEKVKVMELRRGELKELEAIQA
jgi:S-adenosylmethionine decarboxylase proenzyme